MLRGKIIVLKENRNDGRIEGAVDTNDGGKAETGKS